MKPELLSGLSPAEKAYFETGGAVDPVSGKAVEETSDESVSGNDTVPAASHTGDVEKPGTEGDVPGAADGEGTDGGQGDADDSDDEVTELADGTNPDGAARRKVISFGAYDKQRVKANKLSTELEQTRQQLAYLTGLVQQRQGGPQAPAQAAQPQGPQQAAGAPDPQKEPQKWLEWVNSTLTAAQQAQAQQQQQSVQQQQINQLNAAAYQAEQEFVNGDGAETPAHPDYYDALKFLDTARRTELKLAGYDPQTAQAIIDAQNKDIAMRALQAGDNAAKRFYTLAKSRGFSAPKPAAVPAKSEAEKVAEQAAKQKTNKSIAGLAGAGSGELSLESLANTPPEEFNKMFKDGKVQKMLGIPV